MKKRKKSSFPEALAILLLIGVISYYGYFGRNITVNAQTQSMKLITAVEQISNAQASYFSKHKKYTENLQTLTKLSPENLKFISKAKGNSHEIEVKNGWDYEVKIYKSSETFGISALYTDGRFKNSGFFYNFKGVKDEPAKELLCKEPRNVPRSDYCKNIMGYSKLFSYRPEYRVYKKVNNFEDVTGEEVKLGAK